jgi:deferrochelatase/peroxidase EfeB
MGFHLMAQKGDPTDVRLNQCPRVVRLHRMIRRGTAYGALLPEGVLEDDAADRGLMFAFVGAHLKRQFEFVQSERINGGDFLGLGDAKDPVAGSATGRGYFPIPRRPVPRRVHGLARFVVTPGGEYYFMPSLSGLRWLAELGGDGT